MHVPRGGATSHVVAQCNTWQVCVQQPCTDNTFKSWMQVKPLASRGPPPCSGAAHITQQPLQCHCLDQADSLKLAATRCGKPALAVLPGMMPACCGLQNLLSSVCCGKHAHMYFSRTTLAKPVHLCTGPGALYSHLRERPGWLY